MSGLCGCLVWTGMSPVGCGAVLSEVVGSDLGLRLDVQSKAVRYELGCPAAPGQSELGCPV